ncbi:MAG: hypothetical protein AVDCRST_MAG33-2747 [uncultured Thermomicrobiales bacterium]|uniref:Uncharacterized protein n=1 Tax=uncultured Thermomicrobiales bacterium TaxID=1645740 RepID=A0A6J4VA55_9BACT|nr:MAG: hypothetical protein AVDCRST_MAG33-2747 [uncultured Thermomicrobiales bacterium]
MSETGIGLGCEGRVAAGDGTLAPAPDRRRTVSRVARANVPPGRRPTVTDDRLDQTTQQGARAIGMTRGVEGPGAARSAWWSIGDGTGANWDRRPGQPVRDPGRLPEKAKGRRANADRTACLATRSRCAVLRRLRLR